MTSKELVQRAAIACLPNLMAEQTAASAARTAVDFAEALAEELASRGHLQPDMNRFLQALEAEPEPEPMPEPATATTCASCVFCGTGMWCSKHDEYVKPADSCADYK